MGSRPRFAVVRLWLFSQTRLGPGPRQRRRQVQEEGSLPSERSGEGGAKRRSAQAKARKIRVPLARARGGASQEGLVSLHQRSAQRLLSFWFRLRGVGFALNA